MSDAPHAQGRAAALAGQPRTANPHPKPSVQPSGDDYPGPWQAWDWGWHNATATQAHTLRLADRVKP